MNDFNDNCSSDGERKKEKEVQYVVRKSGREEGKDGRNVEGGNTILNIIKPGSDAE